MKKIKAIFEVALLVGIAYLIYEIVFFAYNYIIFQMVQKSETILNIDAYKSLENYEAVALNYAKDHSLEYTVLCWVIVLFFLILVLVASKQKVIDTLKFHRLSITNGLSSILIGVGLVFILNGVLYYLSKVSEIKLNFLTDGIFEVYPFLYIIIVVGIITPIFEELFFRGVLLSRLSEGFSETFAVIISAFLFSIGHLNIVQGIYVFPVGVLAAVMVIKTRSIFSAIWLHIAYNIVNICLANINFFQYNSVQLLMLILLGLMLLLLGFYQTRDNARKSRA